MRSGSPPGIQIQPLSAATWPALAALFEAGGDAKTCWCQFWRQPGMGFGKQSVLANRAALAAQLDDPLPPGLVACRDGEAVGWVAVAPREGYTRLGRSRTIPRVPGEGVWSITCFVVRRTARRSGVATALLAAAAAFALAHGAAEVEGYPVITEDQRLPPGSAYTGTLAMFERAGFVPVAATTSNARPVHARVVVRRAS